MAPNMSYPLSSISFQKVKDNYRLRQIKPSLYYYKRWIWIQFPWICISLHNNYSTTPELKKNIEGEDIENVEDEYKYTKQSLMYAIEAREKKRQMFSKKDMNATSSKSTFKKANLFTISKQNQNRHNFSTQKIKTTPQFDLSLQSLTKELESKQQGRGDQQGSATAS